MQININSEHRITGYCIQNVLLDGIEVSEIPADFSPANFYNWKYNDGTWEYDPITLPDPEPVEEDISTDELAQMAYVDAELALAMIDELEEGM